MKNETIITQLQNELEQTNINDFYIIGMNRNHDLLMLGSFDFSYYHELELIFYDVTYINCPTSGFTINRLRVASEEEVTKLEKIIQDSCNGCIIALEDINSNNCFYIMTNRIEFNFQLVKYYNDLGKQIEGQVISNWARERIML